MSLDATIEIDGLRPSGTAKSKVLRFDWSVSEEPNGKPQFDSLDVMRRPDEDSPRLFEACCSGKHLQKVVLHLAKGGGRGRPIDFLTVKLMEARVDFWGNSFDGEDPLEHVTFAFARIEFDETEIDKGGNPNVTKATWDLKRNTK